VSSIESFSTTIVSAAQSTTLAIHSVMWALASRAAMTTATGARVALAAPFAIRSPTSSGRAPRW
jgi:hypothetical protein